MEINMKKKISLLMFFLGLFLSCFFYKDVLAAPAWPAFPNIDYKSKAILVMETSTQTCLVGKNITAEYAPASITKILTTMVTLEHDPTMSKSVKVTVSPSGASLSPSPYGDTLPMKEALYAAMLESDNAVTASVGITIAGSTEKFTALMNQKAKLLGCKHSHFVTANGLGDHGGDHYTNCYDYGLISSAAFKNQTFRKITGTPSYVVHGQKRTYSKIVPYNNLLTQPSRYNFNYCVGGKTGQTTRAGYTLVTYARKDGMTLTCIMLKGPYHEFPVAAKLYNYCFDNFTLHRIDKEDPNLMNKALNQAQNTFKFEDDSDVDSAIYLDTDTNVVLPKGAKLTDTKSSIKIYKDTKLANGVNTIGKITYTYGKKTVCSAKICLQYYKSNVKNILNNTNESFSLLLNNSKRSSVKNITEILIDTLLMGFIICLLFVCILNIKNKVINNRNNRKNDDSFPF